NSSKRHCLKCSQSFQGGSRKPAARYGWKHPITKWIWRRWLDLETERITHQPSAVEIKTIRDPLSSCISHIAPRLKGETLSIFSAVRQRSKPSWQDNDSDAWMRAQRASMVADVSNYRFVALQPIVNQRGKIFGYEALSRSGWDNCFTGNQNSATWTMV